jgi:hypothetical protein
MKLINFAKIFDTEFGQALAYTMYDGDNDKFGIKIAIATEDLDTAVTLYMDNKDLRDQTFEGLTMEQVTALVNGMLDTLRQLTEQPERDEFKEMLLDNRDILEMMDEEYPDFPHENHFE